MSFYNCENCGKITNLLNTNYRIPEIKEHYLLCQKCIIKYDFISKTECKKRYLLNDSDLESQRILYFENYQNKISLYNRKEVIMLAGNKHGGLDNLQKILDLRKQKNNIRKEKSLKLKEERKNEIIKLFRNHKLKFKYIGDSYSYINYGKPSIEYILENEQKKIMKKNKRRIKLAKHLMKLNIPLDENIEACHNYINMIGCLSLNETIKEIEIEHFLLENTNYKDILINNKKEKAQSLAFEEYMKNGNKKDIPKIIEDPIIVEFN